MPCFYPHAQAIDDDIPVLQAAANTKKMCSLCSTARGTACTNLDLTHSSNTLLSSILQPGGRQPQHERLT